MEAHSSGSKVKFCGSGDSVFEFSESKKTLDGTDLGALDFGWYHVLDLIDQVHSSIQEVPWAEFNDQGGIVGGEESMKLIDI